MPSRQHRHFRHQAGYIAVYVIAIVLLLTGVVIEGTRMVREKAALARQSSIRVAALTRTHAAQQWFKAGLEATWSLGLLERPSLQLLAELQPRTFAIDNVSLLVAWEDADLKPDANEFTEAEWRRLLLAYQEVQPDMAVQPDKPDLAKYLLQLKQSQANGKFNSVADFGDSPFLPPSAVEGNAALPPLRKLLAVGNATKRLHVQYSPLPLFAAILAAGPEQLAQWQSIRNSRIATVADAELVFGPAARQHCYEGEMQHLRLRITAGIAGDERELLARQTNGRLIVTAL